MPLPPIDDIELLETLAESAHRQDSIFDNREDKSSVLDTKADAHYTSCSVGAVWTPSGGIGTEIRFDEESIDKAICKSQIRRRSLA